MVNYDGKQVVASRHAVEQALSRVPVCQGASATGAKLWLERTAARGLRDGRFAKRIPRWCVRGAVLSKARRARLKQRIGGESRFVWNEDLSACLVVQNVHAKTHESGERCWLVITVLTPRHGKGQLDPLEELTEAPRAA